MTAVKRLAPFSEWPVQSEALQDLYQQLSQGTVPHAMLLIGHPARAEQITKYLAKLLLCVSDAAPCGQCSACLAVAQDNHPDFHVIDGQETGGVKTAAVESLQGQLALRAHAGGRLIYAIRSIDTATPAAANRLLKTLEEPQSPIVALLTAVHARRVLPTILSRCFQYALESNRQWDDPTPVALEAAYEVEGAGADSAIDGASAVFAAEVEPMIQWTRTCLSRSAPTLQLADAFMKAAGNLPVADALHVVSLWLRDVLHVQTGQSAYIRFSNYQEELKRQAQLASTTQIARVIERILDAKLRLQSHVAPLLNVEQMCIRVQRGLADV